MTRGVPGPRAGHSRLPAWVAGMLIIGALASAATVVPDPAAAATTPAALSSQADGAYDNGERERARDLYRAVLVGEPDNSRAIYRLATLLPQGTAESIALFRRYTVLEPQDPWGHMALGDALAAGGAPSAARGAYETAYGLAPRERDVFIGLGRLLLQSGYTDEAISVYERWTRTLPQDALAWRELGRARQRARRHPEAAEALAEAYTIEQRADTKRLLGNSLHESAPAVQPQVARSRDSDDVEIQRARLASDWQFTRRARMGLHAQRAAVSDPRAEGTADEFGLTGEWQPLRVWRLDTLAGFARTRAEDTAQDTDLVLGLRARFRAPHDGPAGELRFDRNPLIATPALLADPVQLAEVRGMLDMPLYGRTRARLRARYAELHSGLGDNRRVSYDSGLVYRLQPTVELSVNYHELAYEELTEAGYSAPQEVQSVELGTYMELYGFYPVTIALDLGVGRQRIDEFSEPVGAWGDALRLWAQVSWDVRPGTRLDLELDSTDTHDPDAVSSTDANWRYSSIMLSLRVGLGARSPRSFVDERSWLERRR
ncbi:MAG: tetratricopeptide repeat protein [Gammaproteobacteria bacterium]|nr:tetratricopeptide repeat protein [Gammaproteobacteria bacterium]